MKTIDIVIATRNRYEKLMMTLNSIPEKDFISIWIVSDGDSYNYDKICLIKRKIFHILIKKHRGSVYCRNKIIPNCQDGVLYATDDIIFNPNSIENAFHTFNTLFPDDDGVIGFMINLPDWHPTGVALVGKKFIDRYPKRQLFYPGYFHFSCQEIHWLASKLNKLHQEPTAKIEHRHPCFFKEEMDATHKEARIHTKRDHALIYKRQSKGLIWGLE